MRDIHTGGLKVKKTDRDFKVKFHREKVEREIIEKKRWLYKTALKKCLFF